MHPQQSLASSNQATPHPKQERSLPDPDAEVIALSPKTLLGINKFVCGICNKGFQWQQILNVHRRKHNLPWKLEPSTNKEVKKKVYVCPESKCVHHDPSRAFEEFTAIKEHFCRKHAEEKWKCEKCSKRYAVQSEWKVHSKTCGTTKKHRCDCGTVFSGADRFVSHKVFCEGKWQSNHGGQPTPAIKTQAEENSGQDAWEVTDNTFSPLPQPGLLMPESFSSRLMSITLPSTLFYVHPSLLRELDLSHTTIKSLPESLPNLVALQKLILKCCDLFMELSPQVGELLNLEELDLSETEILGLPQEIRKLSKLKYLRVSFYGYLNCGKGLQQSSLVHTGTISALSQLTELSIDANPDDERWNAVVEAVVEEACNLKTLGCLILYLPNIESLGKRRIGSTSLSYYPLRGFKFTVGQHKQRSISRVPKEVKAHFQEWDKCLKFVKGKDIPREMKSVLKSTTAFYLDCHATARSLSDFGIENMQQLEFCLLAESNEIQTIINGVESCKEPADMLEDDPDNSESLRSHSALEPALLNLQHLHIFYLKKLVSIWNPTSLMANLGKLEVLVVKNCPEVTCVVKGRCNEFINPLIPYLPSLKRISLLYLPKLVSISGGFQIAPKLEKIGFYNCPKLECLTTREMSSGDLVVIRGESKWWEALKWHKSDWWNKNRLDYLQSIFSPLSREKDVMTQMEEM
ncbi:hypothetical protein SLEP1_g40735 [Rubroshorea leprosula]|uniref:C2H2-type domain-containing protein n=1 Tax=Rubroshorea leprosula TaxID=152421 RepID=A0AAV5L4I3_9ROSI|nr:hypothetical protein SLEP1_g40735 [Rubroshorea leprosula]